VVFRAVVFKLLVWCGAEGYVSGLQDAGFEMLRSLNGSNYKLCCTVRHISNHVTVPDLDCIQTSVEFLHVSYKKYLWKM